MPAQIEDDVEPRTYSFEQIKRREETRSKLARKVERNKSIISYYTAVEENTLVCIETQKLLGIVDLLKSVPSIDRKHNESLISTLLDNIGLFTTHQLLKLFKRVIDERRKLEDRELFNAKGPFATFMIEDRSRMERYVKLLFDFQATNLDDYPTHFIKETRRLERQTAEDEATSSPATPSMSSSSTHTFTTTRSTLQPTALSSTTTTSTPVASTSTSRYFSTNSNSTTYDTPSSAAATTPATTISKQSLSTADSTADSSSDPASSPNNEATSPYSGKLYFRLLIRSRQMHLDYSIESLDANTASAIRERPAMKWMTESDLSMIKRGYGGQTVADEDGTERAEEDDDSKGHTRLTGFNKANGLTSADYDIYSAILPEDITFDRVVDVRSSEFIHEGEQVIIALTGALTLNSHYGGTRLSWVLPSSQRNHLEKARNITLRALAPMDSTSINYSAALPNTRDTFRASIIRPSSVPFGQSLDNATSNRIRQLINDAAHLVVDVHYVLNTVHSIERWWRRNIDVQIVHYGTSDSLSDQAKSNIIENGCKRVELDRYGRVEGDIMMMKDITREAFKGHVNDNGDDAGQGIKSFRTIMGTIDERGPSAEVLGTWFDIWIVTLVHKDLIYAIFCISRCLIVYRPVFMLVTSSKLLPLFVGGEFKSIWNVEADPTKTANSVFDLDDSLYPEVVHTQRDMEGWHDLPCPDFILCGAGIIVIVSTGPGVLDNMIILSQIDFGIIKYDPIIERELHLLIFCIQSLSRPIQQIIYELGNVSTDVKSLIAVRVLIIRKLNETGLLAPLEKARKDLVRKMEAIRSERTLSAIRKADALKTDEQVEMELEKASAAFAVTRAEFGRTTPKAAGQPHSKERQDQALEFFETYIQLDDLGHATLDLFAQMAPAGSMVGDTKWFDWFTSAGEGKDLYYSSIAAGGVGRGPVRDEEDLALRRAEAKARENRKVKGKAFRSGQLTELEAMERLADPNQDRLRQTDDRCSAYYRCSMCGQECLCIPRNLIHRCDINNDDWIKVTDIPDCDFNLIFLPHHVDGANDVEIPPTSTLSFERAYHILNRHRNSISFPRTFANITSPDQLGNVFFNKLSEEDEKNEAKVAELEDWKLFQAQDVFFGAAHKEVQIHVEIAPKFWRSKAAIEAVESRFLRDRPIPIKEPLILFACNNVNPCSRYQLHYSGLGSQRVEHMKGLAHGSGPATFHEVARFPSFRSLPLSLTRAVYFITHWSARSNNVESTVT